VLGAAALAAVLLLAGGGLWLQRQRAGRQAEAARQAEALRQEVGAVLGQVARFRRGGHFEEGRQLLEQARRRVGDGGPADLRGQVEQASADTDLAERLDAAQQRVATLVGGHLDRAGAQRDYAAALRESGLAQEGEAAGAVAARVRASAVRAEVVAALDHWASLAGDGPRREWLLAVARAADPDSMRDRLRQPALWRDRAALARLAREAAAQDIPPQLTVALAVALGSGDGGEGPLLRAALARRPQDFWLNFELAGALYRAKQLDEAIGYLRAARALRPRAVVAHANLGALLLDMGKPEEAIGHCEQALRLGAKDAETHFNLGRALKAQGKPDEAIRHYQEALRLEPRHAKAHNNLGQVLHEQGKLDEAVRHYQEALRLDRNNVQAHYNLGIALREQGKLDEAVGQFEQALRLDPRYANAHNNLGLCLYDQGKVDEAVGHYQEALRLGPKHAPVHCNLGIALRAKGRLDEAIRNYEEALRLDPRFPRIHLHLGTALSAKGKLDEAIRHYEEALRLGPPDAPTHYILGNALKAKGKLGEAADHYREALRLDPKYAQAHCNLGYVLKRQGRFEEALAAYKRGHELGAKRPGWRNPSGQWVRDAERLVELDRKLPAVLQGQARPAGAAEQLGLADLCTIKKWYAASARFYAGAFAADPKLADDLPASHRYHATCCAALAAAGQGTDAPKPDDKERARLRERALGWLRADLALWQKQADSTKAESRAAAQRTLRHWQQDPDLAGVRDKEALAALPAEERAAWEKLWAGVADLLRRLDKQAAASAGK
jgi:tetratricopeptide (TPR) repeat protein